MRRHRDRQPPAEDDRHRRDERHVIAQSLLGGEPDQGGDDSQPHEHEPDRLTLGLRAAPPVRGHDRHGRQQHPGEQRDERIPHRRDQHPEARRVRPVPADLVDDHGVGHGPNIRERAEEQPEPDRARDEREARGEPQRPAPGGTRGRRIEDGHGERQQASRPLRPEGGGHETVEADPPAPGAILPHANERPQARGDKARHEDVGQRQVRVEEQPLRGHRDEGGEAARVLPEQIRRDPVDEDHGGHGRGRRGDHRGQLGHVARRPGEQRDQPGQQRRLVVIGRSVEPRPEPVPSRDDVLGQQRETGLVVVAEDPAAELDAEQDRGGQSDPPRARPPPRHQQYVSSHAHGAQSSRREGPP